MGQEQPLKETDKLIFKLRFNEMEKNKNLCSIFPTISGFISRRRYLVLRNTAGEG